jgi:hypothetical protein
LQVLTQITEGGLSRDQISSLSAAVAQVDAGIQDADLRKTVLNEVSGIGMFFRNTNPEGFPRWPVMTALRAYGLNLSVPAGQGDAAVASQVRQTLQAVTQNNNLGATAQQVVAAAPQQVVLKVVSATVAAAPAKKATPAPVATAVDKLV